MTRPHHYTRLAIARRHGSLFQKLVAADKAKKARAQ